jgi:hypothetical protein
LQSCSSTCVAAHSTRRFATSRRSRQLGARNTRLTDCQMHLIEHGFAPWAAAISLIHDQHNSSRRPHRRRPAICQRCPAVPQAAYAGVHWWRVGAGGVMTDERRRCSWLRSTQRAASRQHSNQAVVLH